jgi:hypothetical protein
VADVVEGLGVIRRGAEVHRHLTVAAVSNRDARGDGGMDLSSVVQQGGRGGETGGTERQQGRGIPAGSTARWRWRGAMMGVALDGSRILGMLGAACGGGGGGGGDDGAGVASAGADCGCAAAEGTVEGRGVARTAAGRQLLGEVGRLRTARLEIRGTGDGKGGRAARGRSSEEKGGHATVRLEWSSTAAVARLREQIYRKRSWYLFSFFLPTLPRRLDSRRAVLRTLQIQHSAVDCRLILKKSRDLSAKHVNQRLR